MAAPPEQTASPTVQITPERRPVAILIRPLALFASAQASSGIVLLTAAVAAILWANSPWWNSYVHLWEFRIGFGYQQQEIFRPLHFWINEGLMTLFFLFAGLEIKRELLTGELASVRRAAMPIAAALGGVLCPALIFTALNHGTPGQDGWGVPMATDIAFVAGVLALLGKRIPAGLAVFLTALAIVDDLFAVLVIAVFYTNSVHWVSLGAGMLLLVVLFVMNRLGVAEPAAYAIPGVLLWLAVLQSGVHATIAGVLLAAMIPGRRFLDPQEFLNRSRAVLSQFELEEDSSERREELVECLETSCQHVEPPLHRTEKALQHWVNLLIMPLFAFANAGVRFVDVNTQEFLTPVTFGVLFGLLLGKPIGILLFSFLSARLRLAERPAGVSWAHIHGAGWLGGIGFTMSLFIGGLAFTHSALLDHAKVGIFSSSILAGMLGSLPTSPVPDSTTRRDLNPALAKGCVAFYKNVNLA